MSLRDVSWATLLGAVAAGGVVGYLVAGKKGAVVGALCATSLPVALFVRREPTQGQRGEQLPVGTANWIVAPGYTMAQVLAHYRAMSPAERQRWGGGEAGSEQELRSAVAWYCPGTAGQPKYCATMRVRAGLPETARS